MNLNNLPKVVNKRKKDLGRGIGSGRGKTSGRGMKGQKARGKIPAANVGAGLILYKKLPYRRGWSRSGGNPPRALKPIILTFDHLNLLASGSHVTVEALIEKGLILARDYQKRSVKVLAKGDLKIPLTVEIPVSKNAQTIIEKAGGHVSSGEDKS